MQAASRHADVAGIFDVFRMTDRTVEPPLDYLREADDGVQRCSQLMAHMGHELVLGAKGLHGAAFRICQANQQPRFGGTRRAQRADRIGSFGPALEFAHEHSGKAGADQCRPQDDEQIERQRAVPGGHRSAVVERHTHLHRPASNLRSRRFVRIRQVSGEKCPCGADKPRSVHHNGGCQGRRLERDCDNPVSVSEGDDCALQRAQHHAAGARQLGQARHVDGLAAGAQRLAEGIGHRNAAQVGGRWERIGRKFAAGELATELLVPGQRRFDDGGDFVGALGLEIGGLVKRLHAVETHLQCARCGKTAADRDHAQQYRHADVARRQGGHPRQRSMKERERRCRFPLPSHAGNTPPARFADSRPVDYANR